MLYENFVWLIIVNRIFFMYSLFMFVYKYELSKNRNVNKHASCVVNPELRAITELDELDEFNLMN